jgi:hypothetical protein
MGKPRDCPKSMSLFLNALIKETADLPLDEERLNASMAATLAGKPRPTPQAPRTPYEHFILDVWTSFSELFQAYDNVVRIAHIAQLRFKPPSKVTPLQFLTFAVEASLNEFYIFQCRLDAFLTILSRKYRKDSQFDGFQRWMSKAPQIVKHFLNPLVEVRGAHVHRRRYSFDDEKLRRAETLELLVVHGGMQKLRPDFRVAMAEAKKDAIQGLRIRARTARDIVSVLFKHLSKDLLDGNGRLRCPRGCCRAIGPVPGSRTK